LLILQQLHRRAAAKAMRSRPLKTAIEKVPSQQTKADGAINLPPRRRRKPAPVLKVVNLSEPFPIHAGIASLMGSGAWVAAGSGERMGGRNSGVPGAFQRANRQLVTFVHSQPSKGSKPTTQTQRAAAVGIKPPRWIVAALDQPAGRLADNSAMADGQLAALEEDGRLATTTRLKSKLHAGSSWLSRPRWRKS